ncbi:exosortase-associated EpsI family protein [Temperatibacter marinus]|uniref:Exosortase-associated EpsI family protein n=1 Tax=Temperatibacter marinus TaxID=1456591 RepID=A0AA52EJQ0_9PROT|nr:exosortase-associated EpsI family protein [Temperatibacter marinus]WND03281.1 exosortase-associated EpsI family protein [Temperatibacter marinus]
MTYFREKLMPVVVLMVAILMIWPLIKEANQDWVSLFWLSLATIIIVISDQKSAALKSIKLDKRFFLLLAIVLIIGYLILELDKLRLLGGAFLLSYGLAHKNLTPVQILSLSILLVLLVPMPYGIEKSIGLWLAQKEAVFFTELAQLMSLNVYHIGSQIIAGNEAITINENCSGTLLLIPALMSFIYVASQKATSAKGYFFLISLALPYAVLFNVMRIGLLLLLHWQAEADLVKSFHDFLGLFVSVLVWILPILWVVKDRPLPFSFERSKSMIATGCVITLLAGFFMIRSDTSSNQLNPNIPIYTSGWIGEEEDIQAEELRILNADFVTRRTYTNLSTDRTIQVTYIFHRNEKDALKHSSLNCFQALGWAMTRKKTVGISDTAISAIYLGESFQSKQTISEVIFRPDLQTYFGEKGTMRIQIVESGEVSSQKAAQTATDFVKTIF